MTAAEKARVYKACELHATWTFFRKLLCVFCGYRIRRDHGWRFKILRERDPGYACKDCSLQLRGYVELLLTEKGWRRTDIGWIRPAVWRHKPAPARMASGSIA